MSRGFGKLLPIFLREFRLFSHGARARFFFRLLTKDGVFSILITDVRGGNTDHGHTDLGCCVCDAASPTATSIAERRTGSMEEIKIGKYRHFKGMEYEVLFIAKHSETLEPMVVYRALYGEGGLWVRPAEMWLETVARDGKTQPRFTYIGD